MSFTKIKVDNPVVDLDGDEMTRSTFVATAPGNFNNPN